MNRRSLIAVGGAAASIAICRPVGATFQASPQKPALAPSEVCAFVPIEVRQRATDAPISALRIGKYWPDQTASAGRLRTWNVDFSLLDQTGISRLVLAWQLTRSSFVSAPSSSVKMGFPRGIVAHAIVSTVRGLESKPERSGAWSQRIPSGSLFVLTSARSSTGVPPSLMDLRYFSAQLDLRLADGSPRDFDALLFETT